MRVLVGGIIGAGASAAAGFFVEYAPRHEMGWVASLVGVITGMCISAAAGAGTGESYGRGALAVVLTMIAMVGGRAVYAKVMQNVTKVSTLAPAARPANDAAEEAPVEVAQGDRAAVAPEAAPRAQISPANTGDAAVRMPRPTASTYEDMNVIWMAAAALAAYFVGKGSGKSAPVIADEPIISEGTAGTTV
jgi:hypothetical protein